MEIFLTKISSLSAKTVSSYSSLLSQKEKSFSNHKKTLQYLVTRALEKDILHSKLVGKYIIKKHSDGKPYIPDNPLYFNISHSHDYIAIAVYKQELGIDMEYMKEREYGELLGTLPDVPFSVLSCLNKHSFYTYWTTHEARIKYYGKTLLSNTDTASLWTGTCIMATDYMLAISCKNKPANITVYQTEPFAQRVLLPFTIKNFGKGENR